MRVVDGNTLNKKQLQVGCNLSSIGELWITLECKSATFMRDMELAEKRFEKTREAAEKIGDTVRNVGVVMGALGGTIVAAMTASVVSLAKTADAFDEMSARTGVSVRALQELTYVSKLSGGSAESMETAFKKMAMSVTAAGEGTQAAKDNLKNLNLTFKDLAGLSPEQQFNKLSSAIAAIQDPTARAAAAVNIFGRSGTSLLPMLAEGSAGIARMRSEADTFGVVLEGKTAKAAAMLGDDLERLSMGVKGLWDRMALALMPTAIEFVAQAKNIIAQVQGWIKENQALFDTIVKGTLVVAAIVAGFGTLLVAVGAIITALPALAAAFVVITGPVGIIIGSIAALVASGYLLIHNWDAVKYNTLQAWNIIKSAVLTAILTMLQGMTSYLSWVPMFGNQLKQATTSVQNALLDSTKQYETTKANYEAQSAAKALAKLRADGAKSVAEDKKTAGARKLSHEEMIQSLSASWAQFTQDYKLKTMDWYAQLQTLGNNFQSSLSTGFNTMFTNIGDGWQALGKGLMAFGDAIKTAIIQQLADMAAAWVMQHVIMAAATKIWRTQEVSANAAVAASKAAATTAWSLWGAIAIGALIGAAVVGLAGGFETGGIVGGNSYTGDHVLAAVNSDEMILSRGQQAQLFAMANGQGQGNGGSNSYSVGDIVINGPVDGQNIGRVARELRDAAKAGMIDAVNLAKTLTRVGNSRASEAI